MSWWDNLKKFGNDVYNGVQNVVEWVDEKNGKNKDDGGQKVEYNQPTTTTTTPTTTTTTTTEPSSSGFTYKDFTTSDTTNGYLDAYDKWKAEGAPVYAASYQEELNSIMKDIQEGKPFSWDMNGDALYQQYKDMYTNQANLGMQNAMAQAAALTGGYGSSYGQSVGQQAYAQQMQGLNDVALDLHDRAYGQYQDELADLYNQYGMLSDLQGQEYNKWLDAVNLYNQEGERLYSQYMDSYNNDLDTYNADKSIAYDEYTTAQDNARADEEWERDRLAAEEDWNKMYGDFERNEDGSIKLDENGNPVGGGIYTRENYFNEQDANPNTTYEGEGMLNGQQVPKALANVPGLTTTNTKLFDESGKFINAAVVSSKDSAGDLYSGTPVVGKGTMTYNIGGKEVTLKTGTSPYTNNVNPDAKNGVFDNGYQPDNVSGSKLEQTAQTDIINGQEVPIYKDTNGDKWIWDASANKYLLYEEATETIAPAQEPTVTPTAKSGYGSLGGRLERKSIS